MDIFVRGTGGGEGGMDGGKSGVDDRLDRSDFGEMERLLQFFSHKSGVIKLFEEPSPFSFK